MSKTLNLLSIDFSYFQNITKEILDQYPEGKDGSSDMTELVWSSYYAKPDSLISTITVREDEIKKANDYIKLCNKDIPTLISTNHLPIYQFICDQMHGQNAIKLHLIHIDMYHDMFDDNYDIDNGNWIKFIAEDFDTYTEWITNPVSKSLYGLDSPKFQSIKTSIPSIPTELYDPSEINAIFICKNTSLLPPHLDKYFNTLIEPIKNNFTNYKIIKSADKIRDIDELIKQKKQLLSK